MKYTPIISALPLPSAARLPWATAVYTTDPMFQVTAAAQFTAWSYAMRDASLAYRDVQVAAALAQVTLQAANIWHANLVVLTLDAPPGGTLATGPDLPAVFSTPGSITHVNNNSVPYNAITSDQGLYGRDALLYSALYQLGSTFTPNPLSAPTATPTTLDDTWSTGQAPLSPVGATVSTNYPLNVSLFKTPDTDLAWRDNLLAAYVAALGLNFNNPFLIANRLYVQSVSTSGVGIAPETYNLISDDGINRTWASYPLMPGHLQLTYNYATQQVTWTSEAVQSTPGLVPVSSVFLTPVGNLVSLVNKVPPDPGPNFYRQKAGRLTVRPWVDQVTFYTNNPGFYLAPTLTNTNNTVYQTGPILLTQTGVFAVTIPALIKGGYNRVSLLVKPDTSFSILGFSNSSPHSLWTTTNSTAATFNAPGVGLLWYVAIPNGTVYYTITFTDNTGPTASFPALVYYNGSLIFDGSWAFGEPAGTAVTTQPVQFTSTGSSATFEIVWPLGQGQLTIESINISSSPAASTYTIGTQLNQNASQSLTFQAIPGRADVAAMDLILPVDTSSPTLNISWTGGAGMCLYIYQLDIVTFSGANLIENAPQYEPHKKHLMQLALTDVQEAYQALLSNAAASSTALEFRTVNPAYGYVWDSTANSNWITALDAQMGGQVLATFKLAGPSDLGRPALIPAGLERVAENIAVANNNATYGMPVLDTLQAWMLLFGARCVTTDFWPTSTRPGQTQPVLPVTAAFDYVLTGNLTGVASILNLTSVATLNGNPIAQSVFTAWTYTNTGPAGGTSSQTLTLTVWCVYLTVGSIYTATILYTQYDVNNNASAGSASSTFTATSATQSATLPVLSAPAGYKLLVNSVSVQ